MIARGEQTRMMWINGAIAIVNIIGNILFIPYYSFVGSAWVTLVTQIALMTITWWWVRDTIQIRRSLTFVVLMSIVGLLGVLISQVFNTVLLKDSFSLLGNTTLLSSLFHIIIGGIVFAIIYLG